ncbi:TPA: hypothetical protein ACGUU0_003371 [Vibrio vulnificus]|nr:hypothetical protein [Vibrio vulnificus]
MQNIIEETLQSGESIRAAGSKYLLVRDATHTLTLRVDTREPVEIKKNDVVLIEGFDMVELTNHHAGAITIQYQITDMPINTQSDAVSVSGAVTVDEINKPIVVSGIQNTVAVRLSEAVEVANFPKIQKVEVTNGSEVQKVEVTNHVELQKVKVSNFSELQLDSKPTTVNGVGAFTIVNGQATIAANAQRKSITIQAGESNQGNLLIAGFIRLSPDGVATIPASNAFVVTGTNGDTFTVGEII